MFRVSGVPEPQKMVKGDPNKNFDINIQFDIQNNDPESTQAKLEQMFQLVQFDSTGKIDMEALLEFAASTIDPVLADVILRPGDTAQAETAKGVAEDLTMIYAGIEVGARPQGAQVAMQIGQQYMQQPDVAQRAQEDEAFGARLEKYFKQYEFQLQQNQNADIGRLGTEPAQFQGIQTPGQQQAPAS